MHCFKKQNFRLNLYPRSSFYNWLQPIPLSSHLSTGTQSKHVPGRCAVGAVYGSHALGPFWMGSGGSVSIPQRFSGGHPF